MTERRQCTAKSKQSGERCRLRPTPGMSVCRFHGGKSLWGPANPNYRKGAYSQYAPTRLAKKIEAHLDDPAVMQLQNEAALLTAQIGEVLEVLDAGGVLEHWRAIAALVPQLRAAIEAEDEKALVAVADALDAAVLAATEERGRWGELLDLIDQKRKVVEAQAKVDARETLSLTEQGVLVGAFVQALGLISNMVERNAALEHLNRLLTLPERGATA